MSSNSPGDSGNATTSGSSEGRPSGGNNNNNNNNNSNSNNNRRAQRPQPNKFKGATEALEGYTFDVSVKGEVYTNVVRKIADHVAREFDKAGEFRLAMQTGEFEELTAPTDIEDTATYMEKEAWKIAYTEYRRLQAQRMHNSQRIYPVITGQCSPALMSRIEAHQDYEDVHTTSDVLGLLRIIRKCINQKATKRNPFHALSVAYTELLTCRQTPHQTPRQYYDVYKQKVDTLIDMGGDLSMSLDFQAEYGLDYNLTAAQTEEECHE